MNEITGGRRWSMATRGFLCQNVVIGTAFGGFGVTVLPVQQAFGVGRGLATLGIGLAVLAMGLGAPLASWLLGRFGMRFAMVLGLVLSASGHALLALAAGLGQGGIVLVFLSYGGLIGLGLALVPFTANILASRWFQHRPGPALGFVNMPVVMALMPLVGMPVIAGFGLSAFYFLMAIIHVLIVPFALGIDEPPVAEAGVSGQGRRQLALRAIAARPAFWALVCGGGSLSAVGIVGVSHLVAYGIERGLPGQDAALLVSVTGGASVVGSFVTGLMCGWLGGARALALIAVLTGIGWAALTMTTVFPLMIAIVLLIGAGGAGVLPSVNALAGAIFGIRDLHCVLGAYVLAGLPFTFGLPPLAGVLHDVTGEYSAVVAVLIAVSFAVAGLFMALAATVGRSRPQPGRDKEGL